LFGASTSMTRVVRAIGFSIVTIQVFILEAVIR
jgi:hypothetical protein